MKFCYWIREISTYISVWATLPGANLIITTVSSKVHYTCHLSLFLFWISRHSWQMTRHFNNVSIVCKKRPPAPFEKINPWLSDKGHNRKWNSRNRSKAFFVRHLYIFFWICNSHSLTVENPPTKICFWPCHYLCRYYREEAGNPIHLKEHSELLGVSEKKLYMLKLF